MTVDPRWLDDVCSDVGGVRDIATTLVRHITLATLGGNPADASSRAIPTVAVTCGALLHGPPGAGKSALARAVVRHAPRGLRHVWLEGGTLTGAAAGDAASYGGAERALAAAFRAARRAAPCVLVIDDAERVAPRRGGAASDGDGALRARLGSLLLAEVARSPIVDDANAPKDDLTSDDRAYVTTRRHRCG